jgi:6-pyruvoyltetrahydropterin/6-carboxytetrahydropterin synthase
MDITRRVEFDAGHRIPAHNSKCRNLHGHRYVLEATISGPLITDSVSEEGMVKDFGDLKRVMMEEIHANWDHAFLAWEEDEVAQAAELADENLKYVWFSFVPTVENLAMVAFNLLAARIDRLWGGEPVLKSVRLYETPNCWADAVQADGVDENDDED